MPHMLPNTKNVIIIYTWMHFSTSPPRTTLNESVLGSGLTTLNKKNPNNKKPNKNYLSSIILIEQTQFDAM